MKRWYSVTSYLPRLGGLYILLVIALAQLASIPGAILGTLSINYNAQFDDAVMQRISAPTPFLILLGNGLLLYIAWVLTPNARNRLNNWAYNITTADTKGELAAWQEITALTWRYGLAATFIAYGVEIFPPSAYFYLRGVTTFDQFVYSLIGGLVSVLAIVIIAVLVIDHLLKPARLALVPRDFETQLTGMAGAGLTVKFQVLIIVLAVISILMVGPVGFHYMNLSLRPENQFLRQAYQAESVIVSMLALILGAILSYFISRTVSSPLRDLIAVFKAVEEGNLTQRAEITATDEIAEVTMHFNRMVARLEELQNSLGKQVEERTRLLKATNEMAKVSSSILDPDDLLKRVITLFIDQFDYYYAALYLIAPGEKWADLKEATGEAGKVLMQNHHRIELSSKSLIAGCIRDRAPRISQNTSEERQRIENPLLPYTRSEVALPLIAGDRVVGALNVQSTRVSDFGLAVIETMQNMAGQIAIAMENARLFQEAQQRIKEMRAIQQQYLLEGWSSISARQDELEYSIGESNESYQETVTPISLRDQIIGQLSLESASDWSGDQKNLVDAVATQAAIALENARLVSESRQIAVRERMLAEINSRIWASTTIDAVLQTAVKELGRRLDASSVSIEMSLDDKP